MKVNNNLFVEAKYKLFIDDEEGKGEELVEETTEDVPFQYIHGLGLMLPAFEEKLLGLEPGDTFDFFLEADQAYGQHQDDYVTDLPKEIFHVNGKFDDEMVKVDATIPLMDSEGNQLLGRVLEILENHIKVDLNHPLAGEKLHFVGEIVEVHEATTEEINKFFPQQSACGSGGCCGCTGCH